MKRVIIFFIVSLSYMGSFGQIIDHNCTILGSIPSTWIASAKSKLHIAYEHSSHGSQIVDGMTGLNTWKGDVYAFNDGGTNGALDLSDHAITGWSDLGQPDLTAWADFTRSFLNKSANSDVNVVMWAWCGQVSYATESNITSYLGLMAALEHDYPNVKFVYMTGHLDGSGLSGNLHLRNEQIRNYCRANNKILFDFADIESYDPDGVYYGNKLVTDGCNFDFDEDGTAESSGDPALPVGGDRNWAIDWQNTHTVNADWYNCSSAHTQPLNANRKAYAAWWMWARLAGWNGIIPVTGISLSGAGGNSSITTDDGTLQLSADFLPLNASNKGITWSIVNGTGQATINSNGLVSAIDNGTVTAKATATDGSGVFGTLMLTLSNQINQSTYSTQLYDSDRFKVFSDKSKIKLELTEDFLSWDIRLFNFYGNQIYSKQVDREACSFDVSSLPPGLYIVVLSNGLNRKVIKVAKQP